MQYILNIIYLYIKFIYKIHTYKMHPYQPIKLNTASEHCRDTGTYLWSTKCLTSFGILEYLP